MPSHKALVKPLGWINNLLGKMGLESKMIDKVVPHTCTMYFSCLPYTNNTASASGWHCKTRFYQSFGSCCWITSPINNKVQDAGLLQPITQIIGYQNKSKVIVYFQTLQSVLEQNLKTLAHNFLSNEQRYQNSCNSICLHGRIWDERDLTWVGCDIDETFLAD